MKITFIGTSHGVPSYDRYCQSILIESEENLYLIDGGAPVIDWLIRNSYDLTKLRAVFVTHCHGDHMNGLISLADLAGWYFTDMNFDIFLPDQYVGECFVNYINACTGPNNVGNERIRIKQVDENFLFDDGNVKVTTFPTLHMADETGLSFGYFIESNGKKLCLTGDLDGHLTDFPEITNTEDMDALIVECAHFMAEQLLEKIKNTKAAKVMVVHVYPLDKYDVLKEYAKKAPFEIILPNDSDQIEI